VFTVGYALSSYINKTRFVSTGSKDPELCPQSVTVIHVALKINCTALINSSYI
jgi:hypothetical protein